MFKVPVWVVLFTFLLSVRKPRLIRYLDWSHQPAPNPGFRPFGHRYSHGTTARHKISKPLVASFSLVKVAVDPNGVCFLNCFRQFQPIQAFNINNMNFYPHWLPSPMLPSPTIGGETTTYQSSAQAPAPASRPSENATHGPGPWRCSRRRWPWPLGAKTGGMSCGQKVREILEPQEL